MCSIIQEIRIEEKALPAPCKGTRKRTHQVDVSHHFYGSKHKN